tara:strand:- start:2106 stop:3413 length:1308 start_codon:yes stop_codon:yes gene_type:complete
MIDKIEKYIKEKKLFSKKDRLLLAISGGADSVCLFYILKKLDYHIELAHCNFQLRGRESIEDEEFITSLAEKYNVNLYLKRFNTNEYAKTNQVSIQVAARNLRYDWFEKLLKKYNLNKIVIAHNNDDKIETFFINLLRGTGLKGLTSMKAKAGNIVRPLLILSRQNIESYLDEIDADYRLDSSNQDIKYLRNKIRHNLIPVFKDINPDFKKIMTKNISNLNSINRIIDENILQLKQKLIFQENETYKINIKNILNLKNTEITMYHVFSEYGFTQIDKIIKACKSQSGKIFYSKNYQLVIDREYIIIEKIEYFETERDILISENLINYPISMSLRVLNKPIEYNVNCANLDFDKLSFPLKLRKWKKGDRFQPLGMNNFKKLSDYFIDQKYSILEKKRQWILCSGDDIIWIVGNRIDERYKVESYTKKVYIAEILDN